MIPSEADLSEYNAADLHYFIEKPRTAGALSIAKENELEGIEYYSPFPIELRINQDALRACISKIKEIKREWSGHTHIYNMVYTYHNLLDEMILEVSGMISWTGTLLGDFFKWLLKKYEKHQKYFKPLHEILMSGMTHAKKQLYCRVYWFEFFITAPHQYKFQDRYERIYDKIVEEWQTRIEEHGMCQENSELHNQSCKLYAEMTCEDCKVKYCKRDIQFHRCAPIQGPMPLQEGDQ